MKRFFSVLVCTILVFPLLALAGDGKKESSLFQDLKQAGKEVKESAKDVGKKVKKDAKEAGKELRGAGNKAKKDLKKSGKDAKKSGKGFTNSIKSAFKRAGKTASDAWHGFLNFLGFGKGDKSKKKDNPSERVFLDSNRAA